MSARAVIRSGVGVVSGVDRSPALQLLWVLSAFSVPSAPPSMCPSTRCTADSAPSVLLSATGLDSSATPKPRPPAGWQEASLQLSSPQLSSPASASAQLTSAQLSSLRMGPSAGRPHSVSPLAWNLQPHLPRCHQLVRSARASGPRAAQPATGRMGRAERCSQPVRLSPLAPRSGPSLRTARPASHRSLIYEAHRCR